VAESQAIHQIEYRWQQARDMSAVASSMSPASCRLWVQRIGAWVRHPGVDAPTDSVRYEMFGDRSAALAWRQRDRQAVGSDDGRPLASRVLVGPADLLNPEVAMTVCYTGLPPDIIGPRPGAVTPGDPLPTVDAGWLTKLVHDNTEGLDLAAASEAGLERVVAAALGHLDTPLSVELPERWITRSPRGGSQALLLWGIWTTVSPLIGHAGRRGWSFSTFELPLSDMDPETLPDIVFRLSQPAPQTAPMTTRTEIRVRPQDPVAPPVETMPQHLAKLLVIAYQDYGGEEFTRLITTYAGDYKSTDQRIQAVYRALAASLSPVTVVTEGTGTATVRMPVKARPDEGARVAGAVCPAPDVAGQPNTYSGEVAPTVSSSAVIQTAPPAHLPSANHASAVPSRPSQPTGPGPVPPSPPVASPSVARVAVSPGKSPWDAPELFPDGSQPKQAEEAPLPETLSGLLALLSAGPTAQQFESAMHALTAQNFRTGPQDRAAARQLIRDHRWYLDVFGQHDQAEREAILVGIFWYSVIPDLADEQVLDELAYWVGTLAAPDVVINALYQATEGAAGAQPLVDRALAPALTMRWLSEHRIHVPTTVPAPGQGAAPGLRDQGTGPQHTVVSPAPQPMAAPQAPQTTTGPQAAAQPVAGPQAPAHPSADLQTLLSLLEGKLNVPVPLVLAVCIAMIVLLIVR
jgi:hypothetical protein